ncbi:protein shisa-like-2B isoform X1 [Petromyzon marinus]|uniref:protein shisa-like-2B isoform X1 n=1 Tax=Petromyzon marinus TaxID=7757 RepID=UPI003F6ED157
MDCNIRAFFLSAERYCAPYNGTASSGNPAMPGFVCPRPGDSADDLFCCGFSDAKYCCSEIGRYFDENYDYMWRLGLGAVVVLVGAAAVFITFVVCITLFCFIFFCHKAKCIKHDAGLLVNVNLVDAAETPGEASGCVGRSPPVLDRSQENGVSSGNKHAHHRAPREAWVPVLITHTAQVVTHEAISTPIAIP